MQAELLRSVSFLKDLSEGELLTLSDLITGREVKSGEKIIVEGESVDSLFLITKGTAHVRRRAQIREVLLGRIGVGGFFGEINLFDPSVATATVVAVGATRLAVIPHEALRQFMEANPAAGYKITSSLLGEVSRRLRLTNQRLVNAVYWATSPDTAKTTTL
jgi:CRP/FNR family transcriptional regulator